MGTVAPFAGRPRRCRTASAARSAARSTKRAFRSRWASIPIDQGRPRAETAAVTASAAFRASASAVAARVRRVSSSARIARSEGQRGLVRAHALLSIAASDATVRYAAPQLAHVVHAQEQAHVAAAPELVEFHEAPREARRLICGALLDGGEMRRRVCEVLGSRGERLIGIFPEFRGDDRARARPGEGR